MSQITSDIHTGFRLATLLDWNHQQRDQRRLELAETFQAEEQLRADLRAILLRIQELGECQRRLLTDGPISSESLLDHQRYQAKLQADLKLLRQRDEQLQGERAERQAAVQEADQQVRMLEHLRDKQETSAQKRLDRYEQRTQDDLSARQHHRQHLDDSIPSLIARS